MITKLPPCYDISHWKEVPDFKLVYPRPIFFITKATEAYPNTGYVHTDDKFQRFFQGMMEIGVIRGAYHFHRKNLSPVLQAQHFVNTISKMDILPSDRLILDVEEGGETAAQLWAWFEYVKARFPDNQLLLYSRKNILDPIAMTVGEKEYFKKILTWTAGYPYFPDLFSSVPSGYVPDQTKYGKTVLWQYSDKGVVDGIVGSADLNWIEPTFAATLGNNFGETVMANFTGKVTYSDGAKVWNVVGGQQISTVKYGTSVRGDGETNISGVNYVHLTYPVVGWSKKQWFLIVYETTPPPPPPPEPVPTGTVTHTIRIFPDGKISVDDGAPY